LKGFKKRACRACCKRILAAIIRKLGNYSLVPRDTFLALGHMSLG